MSRVMHEKQSSAYRAVITRVTYGGDESTTYAGPYATIGAAKGQMTRKLDDEKDWARYRSRVGNTNPVDAITGYIERSSIVWERVEG